jgi:hypothetical protein
MTWRPKAQSNAAIDRPRDLDTSAFLHFSEKDCFPCLKTSPARNSYH